MFGMQSVPNAYEETPEPAALLARAGLWPPVRRLREWWERLLSIGVLAGLSPWQRKRVRLLNGIAGIALAVLITYSLVFAASPDRVTFWLSVLGVGLNLGTLLLNYFRRYEASAYYTIISIAAYYAFVAIGKKNDATEYFIITNSIMTMLFFRRFHKIAVLFLLNVAAFFAVQYATKVVPPFLYIPESAPVHNTNVLLFILTLFLVVAHFRAENREQEKQLKRQNDALNCSLAELKTAQDQLVQREKMAFLGELTAGIAHELQNPLVFMKNFAEVSTGLVDEMAGEHGNPTGHGPARPAALEQEILAGLKQNLRQISEHGQRATSIISDMLTHSRTGTSQRVPTDLNALVEESLRLAYQGLQANDKAFRTTLTTAYDPALPPVAVVPPDLRRVLINLFGNALYAVRERQYQARAQAIPFEPELTVTTRAEPGAVEIRVRDNGTGMPEAVRSRVFQPFFTTKPPTEGTGLGLSMSHDIVTKGHGGTLTVSSAEGVGTEFIIYLPRN